MSRGYELFRVRGVAVRLHGSFLFLAALLVLMAMAAGGTAGDVASRLAAPFFLFCTVILHEIAHALVAVRLQVPVVDIVLTPLGGAARLHGTIEDPTKEIFIAAAGPFCNLVLAALSFFVMLPLDEVSRYDIIAVFELDNAGRPLLGWWASLFFTFNLLLGVLNLVPAFPMDGGRILRGMLARRSGLLQATRAACRLGIVLAVGMILAPFLNSAPWTWTLPFVGIFLIWSGLRERLVIEAREGVRRMEQMLRQSAGARHPDARPEHDDRVIDVRGSSRVVDE